jgi:AcrR family transcriptional regulator
MKSQRLRPTHRRIHAAALKLFAQKGATQLAVSELAAEAGVARGTIYNNTADNLHLFDEVAAQLVEEMTERLWTAMADVDDAAARMACGVRSYVRRAHDEPDWGRFVTRFAYSSGPLRRMWEGGPGSNLRLGIEQRRYALRRTQLRPALGMTVGGVLGGMAAVLDGDATWRVAGRDIAELLLVGLGVERHEARVLSTLPLPPLPPLA